MAEGVITDEGLARLRARIGVPEPHPVPPRFRRPGIDAFRMVAEAYGDDNPLWCSPDYGTGTRWGGPIAPPTLVGGDSLIGEDEVPEVPAEHRETMKGDPLRGVHAFYSASEREWWAPLVPDQRVWRRNALVAALDKPSDLAGRAVHEWTAQVFTADGGPVLSGQYRLMIRTERSRSRERKRDEDLVIEPYTDEEIDRIEAQYASEKPRGAVPRFWEDTEVGDPVGPMVKGPLTVTDMVCWHAGVGMGLYGVAALRLGAANRRRIPRFYTRNELNVPDVAQRLHWDPVFARTIGNASTFDYGRMRENWLIHLCTDWMGDDAWLWRLGCEFRAFNYVGDTQWLTGEVVRKYVTTDADGSAGHPAVDLELRATNQRGVVTTPGHATVLLPSREHGSVRLPDPPGGAGSLAEALTAISERFDRT